MGIDVKAHYTSSPRANNSSSKYTNYYKKVQFGEVGGLPGGMAPALELSTTPGHGYCNYAVMLLPGSILQNRVSAGKHRGYWHFCCLFYQFVVLYTFFFRSFSLSFSLSLSLSLSLSRGTSLAVSLYFSLTGTLQNHLRVPRQF